MKRTRRISRRDDLGPGSNTEPRLCRSQSCGLSPLVKGSHLSNFIDFWSPGRVCTLGAAQLRISPKRSLRSPMKPSARPLAERRLFAWWRTPRWRTRLLREAVPLAGSALE